MSKKAIGSPRQQAFLAATKKGDLAAQVQIAREEAYALLNRSGLNSEEELNHVTALAGDFTRQASDDADRWFDYLRHLQAAYALGIAIGQLVHADVFTPNGQRHKAAVS